MKEKKRELITILIIFLITGIFFVNAVSHNANEIIIKIDGTDRTLQYAVDNDLLSGSHIYESPSETINPGHSVDEIWISTDNGEMTLLDALSGGIQLRKTSSFLGYSLMNTPRKFQLATNIILSSGQSLQDIINDESLAGPACTSHSTTTCYDYDLYWVDSCGNREGKKQDCGPKSSCSNVNYRCDKYSVIYDHVCGVSQCLSNSYCGWTVTSSETKVQTQYCSNGCSNGACKSAGGGGSVICTELHNLGYLSDEDYQIDKEYFNFFSDDAVRGYHAFGIPAVNAIKKNPEIVIYILPLVKSFTEEMAYRLGKRETGNEIGALFLDKGVPLFEKIALNSDESLENYFTEEKVKEIYYDAKEKSNGSNKEFAKSLLDNLEKSAEEIETINEN